MGMERKEWLRRCALTTLGYITLINFGGVTGEGMRKGWGVRGDGSAISPKPKDVKARTSYFKAHRAERKQRWKDLGHAK